MIEINLDRLFSTLPQRSDANEPLNLKLWAKCLAESKQKYKIVSAYSNSYAAKRYKELGGKWRTDDLRAWHKESWKAINSSGEIVGECGSGKTKGKPKCLPEDKARSLSKEERAKLAKRKQKQDPDKERSGKPIMVSSDRADENKLYFFEENGKKRRTGIVASSAEAARKKCQRGCGRIYKVRSLTAAEEKTAHAGKWVRSTASGGAAGSDRHISGFGPKLKN